MKNNKKKSINIFSRFIKYIDKKIILPITKIILNFTSNFDGSNKNIEKWLSSSNTLLFISLFIAFATFLAVDQKTLFFADNSAIVLKDQQLEVQYNDELYVLEGIPKSVDITLMGSKQNLYFAQNEPGKNVVINLKGYKPGTHKVDLVYPRDLDTLKCVINPSTINVTILPKVPAKKTITIDILNMESIKPENIVNFANLDDDQVTIKGAQKDIDRVANVKALVDMKNLVDQEIGTKVMKDVMIKAYDSKGDVIDVEIIPNKKEITAIISSPNKVVPLRIIPKGEVSFGLAISNLKSSIEEVKVYASQDILDTLNFIPIEVDVTGLTDTKVFKKEIVVPTGVKSINVKNLDITISVDKSTTKELQGLSIEYRNLNKDFKVQANSGADTKVDVSITGVDAILKAITNDDVVVYLDLNNLGIGSHEVDVLTEGKNNRVTYLPKTTKVKINIMKK